MKCPNCGFENNEGVNTCSACGGNLNTATSTTESNDSNSVKMSEVMNVTTDDNNVNVSFDKDKMEGLIEGTTKLDENTNLGKDIIGMFVPADKVDEVYNNAQDAYKKKQLENQSQPVTPKKEKKHMSFNQIRGIVLIIVLILAFIVAYLQYSGGSSNSSTSKVTTTTTTTTTTTQVISLCNNKYDENGDFLYAIDHYKFTGTGVVLDGIIYSGTVNVGDDLQITGMDFDTQLVTISNIKVDDTEVTSAKAKAGQPVTLIIDKVSSNSIFYGQVVIKPDSIKIHKRFNADIKLLSSSNGGRHTSITSSYYTNIVFRSEDHDPPGTIYLPEGKDSLNPGESSSVTIELKVNSAMEIGDCFVIREGEKEIGSGTVTEFLD